MDIADSLENYPRYIELSKIVNDNMVYRYASAPEVTEAEFLEGTRYGDICHRAIYLHEKEELYRILEAGISLEDAVRDRGGTITVPPDVHNAAHNAATRVELEFLKHVASAMNYNISIEALGISNPLFLAERRGMVFPVNGLDLLEAGLLENHPSTDELSLALEFYKKAGVDCEHTAEDIACGLKAYWGW